MFEHDRRAVRVPTPDIAVWWAESPAYADRIIDWWRGACPPLAERKRIPLLLAG
jgi:hypothetical protein